MAKQTFTTGQVLTALEVSNLQANDYNQTVSAKVASYTLVAADAGTRITMSNASATTVTVNTSLFTAGDTLTITNIGVGVSTITAGTATVSTAGSLALNQYDSGTLYFTSTGVSIWNGANPGDITAVTAGTGISGGGTSGAVTVTNSMATAITTNGDVIYGTGSGTFTRLGIGSTSQVLTVTGGVPVWSTPATASSKVVQIVYAKTNTQVTVSTTTWTDTTLTATIIPTSASNKILVFFNQNGFYKSNGNLNNRGELQLLVGATALDQYANYQSYSGTAIELSTGAISGTYLDSPATTSATTYKTQFRNGNASADVRVNQNGIYSTITLMEVTP